MSSFGVGMPAGLLLDSWAGDMTIAFGETCYLVGSAIAVKTWRDVDIRMMLPPEKWERWFAPPDRGFQHDPTWCAMMTALSLWGERVTGLPIDFQMQPTDWANEKYPGGRLAVGVAKSFPLAFVSRAPEGIEP